MTALTQFAEKRYQEVEEKRKTKEHAPEKMSLFGDAEAPGADTILLVIALQKIPNRSSDKPRLM